MSDERQCPYCPAIVPADPEAEIAHMKSAHPEILDQRRRDAGFILIDGKWVDRYT